MGTYIILILYRTPLLATGDKIMRNIKIIALLGLLLLTLAPLAHADYHYASHAGSNTYPYTSWETAADSITAAMRAADPYDTIYIAAGEYNEVMIMSAADSCMTFIGAGSDSTRCWTDGLSEIWAVGNRVVAQGIWFQQYNYRYCFTARALFETVIAKSCKFTGGIGIGGGGDSVVAENCQFLEEQEALNASSGVRKLVFRNNYFRTHLNPSVLLANYSTGIFENNIMISEYDISFGSIFSSPGPSDSVKFVNNYIDNFQFGAYFTGVRNPNIINNTIRRLLKTPGEFSRGAGITIRVDEDSVRALLINNSTTESSYGIKIVRDSLHEQISIKYSAFWDNVYGNINAGHWEYIDTIGNIDVYPMFTNPDSFDVYPQAYSPLIDAGDPNILDVNDTRSDIGVFGGPGGSSYEYQDLPPRKPDSLAYQLRPDTIIVRWRLNHEADFNRYIVWRDTISGFTPWAGNIIAEPDTNLIYDTNWDNSNDYYYRIAAYDNQWNMSEISDELVVLISGTDSDNSGVEIPNITSIESNYPNPFNSSTTIAYSVANLGPIPAQINIDIYDIQGRKIRSLLNNRMEVGKHTITWDGRDDSGNELASGIYFARITQWHVDYLSRSQKLILVR
jgi:hypothetical protein